MRKRTSSAIRALRLHAGLRGWCPCNAPLPSRLRRRASISRTWGTVYLPTRFLAVVYFRQSVSAACGDAAVKASTSSSGLLFGRERELHVLEDLIDGINDHGAALLMRGEAGIGKSALLAEASVRARTRDMVALSTTGVHCSMRSTICSCLVERRSSIQAITILPRTSRDHRIEEL